MARQAKIYCQNELAGYLIEGDGGMCSNMRSNI